MTELGQGTVDDRTPSRSPVVLILACTAQFMTILDVSIINVALPSIHRDLGFSSTGLQWVLNAYTLAFAGFLMLGGRAGDYYGRRRLYLIGLSLFSFASLMAGVANSQALLVIARTLQGLGGAILAPTTLAILAAVYTGTRERAKAIGIWAAIGSAGGVFGTFLGGVITQELSWRWIFFVNVPIGLLTIIIGRLRLEESKLPTRSSLDVLGAIEVTAGLTLLVFGIVRSSSESWGSFGTLAPISLGIALLGLFLINEQRISNPMMPLRMFKARAMASSNVVQFAMSASMVPLWFLLSIYFQEVRGYSALRSGIAVVPPSVTIIISAQISSRVVSRFGTRRLVFVASTLLSISFLWLAKASETPDFWGGVAGPSMLAAFAAGIAFTPLTFTATRAAAPHEAGLASGLINTARQMGASIGLAVLVTVATTRSNHLLAAHPPASASAALGSGLRLGWIVAAGFALVGFFGSFALPKEFATRPVSEAVEEPAGETSAARAAPSVALE